MGHHGGYVQHGPNSNRAVTIKQRRVATLEVGAAMNARIFLKQLFFTLTLPHECSTESVKSLTFR